MFDLDGKSEEKRIAKHVFLYMWLDTPLYLTHLWQARAWGVLAQTQGEKVENMVLLVQVYSSVAETLILKKCFLSRVREGGFSRDHNENNWF